MSARPSRAPAPAAAVTFVNLTNNDIVVQAGEVHRTFTPSGVTVRLPVETADDPPREVGGFCITTRRIGTLHGLPGPRPGIVYIVSSIVAQHPEAAARPDVVAPDTSDYPVRGERGKVLAVRGFARFIPWQEVA